MKPNAARWGGASALLLVLAFYFWNPFSSPTWNPIGRFTGHQYFKAPGQGMQPAFDAGADVPICFDTYKHREPKANDVVVFRVPGDEGLLYLKRVAAVAGSTIEIRDSTLIVNNEVISSPFWWAGKYSSPYTSTLAPIQLPSKTFFALGDNLEQSIDSRRFGPIPYENIVGGLCAQQAVAADRPKTGSG